MRSTTLNWAQIKQDKSNRAFSHSMHVFKKHQNYKKNFQKERKNFIHETINSIFIREQQLNSNKIIFIANSLPANFFLREKEIGSLRSKKKSKREEEEIGVACSEQKEYKITKEEGIFEPGGSFHQKLRESEKLQKALRVRITVKARGTKTQKAGYAGEL